MKTKWLLLALAGILMFWLGQTGTANAFYKGPFQWAGLYFGVDGGVASVDKNWSLVQTDSCCGDQGPNDPLGSGTGSGGFFGGQVGYDWQQGMAVFGVQGEVQFANIGVNAGRSNPYDNRCWGGADQTADCSSQTDWMGALTARIGALITQETLVYAKGGIAFAHDSFDVTNLRSVGLNQAAMGILPARTTPRSTRPGLARPSASASNMPSGHT